MYVKYMKLPKVDKYPKSYSYRDMAWIESERLKRSVVKLKPYLGISDIEVLSELQNFYSFVYSGHRKKALEKYELLSWSMCLPKWVYDYSEVNNTNHKNNET